MSDALLWHRIQFAFTITFHYLFPQLTMGLALFVAAFKSPQCTLEPFDGRTALSFPMGLEEYPG
jgi:hypothetical protein